MSASSRSLLRIFFAPALEIGLLGYPFFLPSVPIQKDTVFVIGRLLFVIIRMRAMNVVYIKLVVDQLRSKLCEERKSGRIPSTASLEAEKIKKSVRMSPEIEQPSRKTHQ